MSEQSNTTWFIFTNGNSLANHMIADTNRIGPEDECPDMLCADGVSRDLVRCPDYAFVASFEEAAKAIAPVPYKIFRKVGQHGKLEERPAQMDPRSAGRRPFAKTAAATRDHLARVQASRR